jgi:pimeloyl-ACP methyl ester carboxylesterase
LALTLGGMSPWVSLILMLLALGALGVAITIALIANDILRPPRLTDAIAVHRLHRLSPGDLGLRFEDWPFAVRDSAGAGRMLHMSAWWIGAPRGSSCCVILLHGHGDGKVAAIAWAPLLHQLNCNVLAVDARAHGESGGALATAGYFERDDLNQVINQLRSARPAESERVILFGLDAGGATAAAVAAGREDIAGVLIDSPVVDRHRLLAAHARRAGLPAGCVLAAALRAAAVVSGADFAAVALLQLLPEVRCALLVIVGEDDELVAPADVAALTAALAAVPNARSRQLLVIPRAARLMALQSDPGRYTQAVADFFAGVAAAERGGGGRAGTGTLPLG